MTAPPLIVNLLTAESRISEVMAGPWQDIRMTRLKAAEESELASSDAEHAGYVVRGTGTITSVSGESFALMAGVAFAIPGGGSVTVTAESDLEFLHIIMNLLEH